MIKTKSYPQGSRIFPQFRLSLAIMFLSFTVNLLASGSEVQLSADHNFKIRTDLNQLVGEQLAPHFKRAMSADETLSWHVYLPVNDLTEPPGVFVYVSPSRTGRIDSRWRSVMDQQNLIYISADKSGNQILTYKRMVLATMALRALGQQHSFDLGRVFVSGFSGGGRVASKLASQYPEVFVGALYICGVDYWKKDQTPNVERILENRFVFLTGSRDFNLGETKRIHRRYLKAGAEKSKLMVIKGLAHAHPDATALTEALSFLSGSE